MFDWDEGNIAHVAEHNVLPREAEEAVTNNPLDLSYEQQNGELRFRQVGETFSGRILVVVSTERNGSTRIITAYPPSRFLRKIYLNHRRESIIDEQENSS